MNNLRFFFALLLFPLLFSACKKSDDAQPLIQLIKDGDMETFPWSDWGFGFGYNLSGNPNGYTNDYTVEAASSPMHSIKIKCDTVRNDSTYCYIYQRFLGANIPVGAKLTLKAKIKMVNMQGNGIALVLRGDNVSQDKTTFFTTTENKTSITGTNEFKEYTITVDAFPANTDYLYIFLVYGKKTTGTSYFDDVSLTVN